MTGTFNAIKYVTSYGEKCTATKNNGIVTIQGDKNGVRQMEFSEFMKAFVKDQALLITGLTNPQVVRTAEMMDIVCICFVRGKEPTEDVIELAKEKGIVLLATDERMFPACGKLYEKGLSGGQLAL